MSDTSNHSRMTIALTRQLAAASRTSVLTICGTGLPNATAESSEIRKTCGQVPTQTPQPIHRSVLIIANMMNPLPSFQINGNK